MSVLIKGMELPESCSDCAVRYEMFCPLRHRFIADEGRRKDCPLIEIPPHGRLIDADEFLKRAIGTKCFRGDYALMLEELVGESTTIIEAEEGE